MFTDGKDRQYESLMQQTPGIKPRVGGRRHFKYVYADVACEYCIHAKICKFIICPYIMDNLDDLMGDAAFITAIDNADACETKHRQTLFHLQSLRAVVDC